jgi:predicted  nucleic acid-binding Zn-ribbon protein
MSNSEPSRLDRLEALAETTLLAIRELSHRQDRTQQQIDGFQQQIDGFQQQMEDLRRRLEDLSRQQALNAEQIAANTDGLVVLRNLIADFICTQNR